MREENDIVGGIMRGMMVSGPYGIAYTHTYNRDSLMDCQGSLSQEGRPRGPGDLGFQGLPKARKYCVS